MQCIRAVLQKGRWGNFLMSCVMQCPACMEDRTKRQWSPAQWEHWDPWSNERNCCVVCQDGKDKYERNTWRTNNKLQMTEGEFKLYVRSLRKGWEQPQQSSRTSRRPQRSRSRSQRRAPASSVWSNPPEWQGRAPASITTLAVPNSPVSSAPTIVAVPALWNPRADAMELHAVPKPLECPPAKDPYPDISTFQKVADAKIDIWRVNAYDKQTVDHLAGDRSRSSRLAPVYEIDFV